MHLLRFIWSFWLLYTLNHYKITYISGFLSNYKYSMVTTVQGVRLVVNKSQSLPVAFPYQLILRSLSVMHLQVIHVCTIVLYQRLCTWCKISYVFLKSFHLYSAIVASHTTELQCLPQALKALRFTMLSRLNTALSKKIVTVLYAICVS